MNSFHLFFEDSPDHYLFAREFTAEKRRELIGFPRPPAPNRAVLVRKDPATKTTEPGMFDSCEFRFPRLPLGDFKNKFLRELLVNSFHLRGRLYKASLIHLSSPHAGVSSRQKEAVFCEHGVELPFQARLYAPLHPEGNEPVTAPSVVIGLRPYPRGLGIKIQVRFRVRCPGKAPVMAETSPRRFVEELRDLSKGFFMNVDSSRTRLCQL